MLRSAKEPSLELLIGSQRIPERICHVHGRLSAQSIRLRAIPSGTRNRPSDESAVIPPVEAEPRPPLPRLILHVCRHVEMLVMVNSERKKRPTRRDRCSQAADLWCEEPRCDTRHDHQCGEPMEVGHAGPYRIAGDFGIVPLDREKYRRVAEVAEIVAIVGVLPDVLAADHQILPEGLLQARMEFIAKPGSKYGWDARYQGRNHSRRIAASRAGNHQIFVEGGLQRSRIGNTQHRICFFDVVSDPGSRFRLTGDGKSVVEISTNSEVR